MLLQQIEKLFGEIVAMESSNNASTTKVITGDAGYVLEDVPHLTDYIQGLPVFSLPQISFSLYLFMFFTCLCLIGFVWG